MFLHPFTFGFILLASFAPPSAAIPSIHSNEAAAIRTLRQIAAAEQAFRSAVEIDTNCDGRGEYGYFAELAGTRPMRVSSGCQPAAGSRADVLVPPILPASFGQALPAVQGFLVPQDGYLFQMWLAGPTTAGLVGGVREDAAGGKLGPPFPDPVNGGRWWICYAWPIDQGSTGIRAFCISQRGVVLQCRNVTATPFSGLLVMPQFDEALTGVDDLSAPLRIGVAGGSMNTIWKVVP